MNHMRWVASLLLMTTCVVGNSYAVPTGQPGSGREDSSRVKPGGVPKIGKDATAAGRSKTGPVTTDGVAPEENSITGHKETVTEPATVGSRGDRNVPGAALKTDFGVTPGPTPNNFAPPAE